MADKVQFQTPLGYQQGDPGISEWGPSLTRQEFLQESDVNFILSQYEKHGILPAESERQPQYGDFTNPLVTNYQEALNYVLEAQAAFAELPPKTRERFHNDPGQLLAFLEQPENREEAIKLGLLNPPPATPPVAPPAAPAPTSTPGVTT